MQGSYESKVSWRHWRRCEFNSIGPVDQIIFSLLGGKVDQLGTRCATWDFPGGRCSCAAPLGLLGKARTVVEIGANDGLHMSNSRFFERQLGWRSLCVEANPQLYKSLKVNRPNCINVNSLVGRRSDFNGSSAVPYISFSPGQNRSRKFRDWQTGLSGIESTHATNNEITSFRRARVFAQRNGLQVERHLLPVAQFSQLFARHGIDKIDLLSIDVEGAEDTVVQSINFQAVRIRMIVIEKPSPLVTNLLIRNKFHPLEIVTGGADQFFLNKYWHEKDSPNERQVAADRHQTSSQVASDILVAADPPSPSPPDPPSPSPPSPPPPSPDRGGQARPRGPTTITVGQWSWKLDATHREIGIGVIVAAVAFGAIVIVCALVLI